MSKDPITITGKCHCGALSWACTSPIVSVTACNCTLCHRYGALWAYGELDHGITVSGKSRSYTQGSKINGFHFCETCGCLIYYRALNPDWDGRFRIAINLRMINEPSLISSLPIDHFDGLESFDDLPRDHRTVRDIWF
jgi:hypothetical protein